MTTSQKIEKLNEACKGSLSIYCYKKEWKVASMELKGKEFFYVTAPTFDAVVDKAYRFVFPLKVSKKK